MSKKSSKPRAVVFVDGSNFYHRLKDLGIRGSLKFSYMGFFKSLVKTEKLIRSVYFVGAIRTERNNPKSYELFRSQNILVGNLIGQGIEV
ncbi:hypothetical protein A2803_03515 [Candidatus Woesebacteria bacterium RIFCSPHIGHO2_01_FULL_44_21]|uniref:NYN domain-containing protein n=1 Tax=Candidatus Woesebacteria bacterium RIFCSPHIGHO2_01_FULL_44_21 TaxID=1802503 RepID=A0A1F7YZ12_9BACT|nr:MAG: hypothetical protein A2803_03515 [Candidatus Woesebacteria bacterium RIFCSPHIGHO2_01_FULL_44_21]OGM69103.1 MAG: hypothetical protein A2897_04725 [Candidatus Woesebacteria bacterium RIFCSPLOWO2_01_FULL_44_24b]